jgi:hypothetical protein
MYTKSEVSSKKIFRIHKPEKSSPSAHEYAATHIEWTKQLDTSLKEIVIAHGRKKLEEYSRKDAEEI